MSNENIAEFLEQIALYLDLKGENPFKVRSYNNAGATLRDLEVDVGGLHAEGGLTRIKGIGQGISATIAEYLERGGASIMDELEQEVPEGLIEMTRIRGLGAARVKKIHQKLGITTLGELEYACLENRLKELKGFGERTQDAILEEIRLLRKYAAFFHIHYSLAVLEEAVRFLREDCKADEAEISGQARRHLEVVNRGVLVAASENPVAVLDRFQEYEFLNSRIEPFAGGLRATHAFGLPIELHVVRPGEFAHRLLWTTGSPEHLARLVEQASEAGFTLNEEGLFKGKGKKAMTIEKESSLYETLGSASIPPALREGEGEIEAGLKHALPDLIQPDRIQGVLHVHTTYSDGRNTLAEMAEATRARGCSYLGISDHSRTASYAGGLSIEKLEIQGKEIEKLNRTFDDFRILHGVESDILKEGDLDYPDEVLARLDFVIASVHSGFRMEESAMTDRLIKAVENPYTRILGHPTGRLLLGREAYDVDLDAVLQACARHQVMVELNANPQRLDLDWRRIRRCIELGIRICINPDAHCIEGLEDIRYGIGMAQKGWLEADHVANCMTVEELLGLWR